MLKHLYFHITFFILCISINTFSFHHDNDESDRGITPLFEHSHQIITNFSIREGHEISNPGFYQVATTQLTIDSADTPTNSHNVAGSSETRGIIAITSSNVHLNLNGVFASGKQKN